ncbi:hypothetical protein BBJ29_001795 [Phytophthora kernoviae]|uniref:Uncharacterized protein n=1 Tax=Phytophthora kernoviae TaxID=325452 RepID=A0A3F2RS95_9STRA|nr:hypothetical protein BBJ29_001795 [Phytophthora kernoviae]RLN62393.1 hypothetical protein BBP00_00004780 [Phytophthora kernoviae]
MIHPLQDDNLPPLITLCYETVQCTELPAFDPLPTLKSIVLSPQRLKWFNTVLRQTAWIVIPIYACGVILRFVSCACAAPVGRIIAPGAALLHLPAVFVFATGIRTEFAKLILLTFDLWFPLAANTVFVVVFSAVLGDLRVILVYKLFMRVISSFDYPSVDAVGPDGGCIDSEHETPSAFQKLDANIRDRAFLNLEFLGKRAQFRVISFLWSRVATIFVWYCRLIYILLTRNHENALIMLRGNVEFDYLAWRAQAKMSLTHRDLGLST